MDSGKRKAEDYPEGEEARLEEVRVDEIFEEGMVEDWICQLEEEVAEEKDYNFDETAWDDVNGGELDPEQVKGARKEEVGYMESREIWSLSPISECWEKTGKVSARWVDVWKAVEVRSRLVARDFKGGDKDRDDLFAATPPLESKRLLVSRAATRVKGKLVRKLLFIDAKKAHLNPTCEEDVYI